ncbi:uncharacterized protein LOC118772574 [Megalops cyprinoides]|uniref:uncharacterized protein LOC118772574 n=1 Tax=Megalops cyprinoides TaxID=118141 RepID=UPI001864945E|nr:uncharacterized protein LOC118772574 [Megalops cyprinoides]
MGDMGEEAEPQQQLHVKQPSPLQTVSWLDAAPSALEECLQFVSYPQQLKTLLQHCRCLGHFDTDGGDMKSETVMDSRDFTGVQLGSILNRNEDIEERMERKSGYGMNSEEKDILSNIKEEEEEGAGEQQSEMKREDGVRDEEDKGLWREGQKESDEEMERDEPDQRSQTDTELKNGGKTFTSCLLQQPRVLIQRLSVSLPLTGSVASKADQEVSFPCTRDKNPFVTQKCSMVSIPAESSDRGTCAEDSIRAYSPMKDKTGDESFPAVL